MVCDASRSCFIYIWQLCDPPKVKSCLLARGFCCSVATLGVKLVIDFCENQTYSILTNKYDV